MPYIFSFKVVPPPPVCLTYCKLKRQISPAHDSHNASNSTTLGQAESKLPEILILTSQPGWHLPAAQERNPSQGGSRSSVTQGNQWQKQKQGALSSCACRSRCFKLLLAELPRELSGPRAPKRPKPLRKGKGGRQEQLLPVGPVFSRTRPEMRNRRERGDEEHARIQLRQTRGLLVHFLQARQPPGPAQNQRPHRPLFLSPTVAHATGRQS